MKVWRLVSGILSIVMFLIITFQSCAVSFVNAIEDNTKDTSDAGGVVVAFILLVAGIVSTSLWKNKSIGGDIALVILFGLAALFGFANQGTFKDLTVWASWALICAVLAAISFFNHRNEEEEDELLAEFVVQEPSPQYQIPTKRCPNCHAEIAANSKFCNSCGQELPQKQYCTQCGTEVNKTAKFCPKCGGALS